jgi:2,3-dihydroxybenzoate-AMP ligase
LIVSADIYYYPAMRVHPLTQARLRRAGIGAFFRPIVRKHGRYLVTEGRKNDLINRGGEKISIDEVENYILKHPAIRGVAVVAMSDPVFGEKACAFVTLNQNQNLTFDELKNFLLAQRIAKFKLPERLEILNEFPISPAGKILRRSLREKIETEVAREKKEMPDDQAR